MFCVKLLDKPRNCEYTLPSQSRVRKKKMLKTVICIVETNSNSSRKRPHLTHELISIPEETVERSILLIRSQKVILDRTLAKLCGVSLKVLNKAVKRNLERFPQDFIFQLTMEEAKELELTVLRSQKLNAPSSRRRSRRCRC
jgi:hypothetical protein